MSMESFHFYKEVRLSNQLSIAKRLHMALPSNLLIWALGSPGVSCCIGLFSLFGAPENPSSFNINQYQGWQSGDNIGCWVMILSWL
jgi:hypothetical protein